MDISQNLINMVKGFEGFKNKAYKPVAEEKDWTIGYGHCGPDVKQGEVITEYQAENILKNDLEHFVHGVVTLLKVKVNQNQFDALVSFAYNCGLGNLENSTLLKLVNKGDFKNAANEFDKWVHGADRKVLPGLVNRRNAEQALFLKPVVQPQPVKIEKPVAPKAAPKAPVIKAIGKIKIVGVRNAAFILDKPAITADHLTTINLGSTIEISGSVNGWWEVIYNGKRAYVNEKFGSLIK